MSFAHVLSAYPRKAAEGPHSTKPFTGGAVASAEALQKSSRKDLFPHSNPPQGLGPAHVGLSTNKTMPGFT